MPMVCHCTECKLANRCDTDTAKYQLSAKEVVMHLGTKSGCLNHSSVVYGGICQSVAFFVTLHPCMN